MSTTTPTPTAPLTEERRSYLIGAVADSHGTSDAAIIRRIRAVSAALAAGLDVKTLTAEINAAASVPGSSVSPISAPVLGQARAVLTFLDRVGVSLPTALEADRDALVSIYRAASTKRAGVSGLKAVADVAVNGESPADKLAIGGEQAESAGRETRKAGGKGDGSPAADGAVRFETVSDYTAALNVMAGAVGTGAFEPTADFVAALSNLVGEVQRVAAARPVRARIAAPAKAAA